MKILLDTNVLIAAFISHGACNDLFEHCALHHEVVASEFILDEFRDKLVSKFGFGRAEAAQAVDLLLSRICMVSPKAPQRVVAADPDDDNIIAAALAGGCECIITGDKALLALKEHEQIRIISPSQFWRFEREGEKL